MCIFAVTNIEFILKSSLCMVVFRFILRTMAFSSRHHYLLFCSG